MGKKIIAYGVFCSCLFFITGCNANQLFTQPVVELHEEPTAISQIEYENELSVTDLQMKTFFEHYLSINEDTILMLNQKPKKVDEEYWAAYRSYHSKTNEILSRYLSDDTNKKLKKQYIHDNFQYFKFIEVNNYMVTGISNVEDAIIVAKSSRQENDLYEVMVTAKAKVIDLDLANIIYQWDDNLGYYIKNEAVYMDNELAVKDSFDQIKINLYYQVEVPKGEVFVIHSVKEKTNMSFGLGYQVSAKNNSFVSRIPYKEEVATGDREKIHQYIDSFLKKDKDFYDYYKQAYHTNHETLEVVFGNELRLGNIVEMKEDNYKDSFHIATIPVKDDMQSLTFDVNKDVIIEPHVSSSEKHPAYEVKIKADVALLKGDIVPYEYTYLFLFENDMISAVRFMTQNENNTPENTQEDV